MDPTTGLVALTGITLASLAGLKINKGYQEGFKVLPNEKDKYPASIAESQTRYNQLMNMVNPLKNVIIPVDSSTSFADSQQKLVKGAVGAVKADFRTINPDTLTTKLSHTLKARTDSGEKSIFALMKFCREGGNKSQPFSQLNPDGTPIQGEDARRTNEGTLKIFYAPDPADPTKMKETGRFDFDEHCGICLTGGVDEEGNSFTDRRGMVMDPDSRDAAYSEASGKGLPYPRAKPPVGQCNGAPEEPNFALNKKDLDRYEKRLYCMKRKQIDPAHQCGVCYENDVYTYIDNDATLNEMSVVLQGIGKAQVLIKGNLVQEVVLDDTKSIRVPLIAQSGVSAIEGDSLAIKVLPITQTSSTASTINLNSSIPVIYGYFQGINPNGGIFTVPLNMLMITDGATGGVPNKAGGFYTFSQQNLEVAKMRPGASATPSQTMNLQGTIPFTFVSGNEFSAIDCPMGPFQKDIKSASAFATDQPCFAKGAKAGNYNDECLRQRILDAGCTNQGDLYKDPKILNKDENGNNQTLGDIYNRLADIKANDMIDPVKTKQCSGRKIESPCDPFVANPDLKFLTILDSTGNRALKTQAQQCLSYLYNNKGANEPGPVQPIGPTYSGIVTYANNRKEQKKIYCIADGQLNPDNSVEAQRILASQADTGFRNKIGIEAIKAYLDSQQQLAVDMTKNANTDPRRREAIRNCFGQNLKDLPTTISTDPTIIQNACGTLARYVRVTYPYYYAEFSQIVVFNGAGQIISEGKDTSLSTPGIAADTSGSHDAANAVNGKTYPKSRNNYKTVGGTASFIVDLGSEMDIARVTVIFPPTDSWGRWGWLYVDLFGADRKPRVVENVWTDTTQTKRYSNYLRGVGSIVNVDFLEEGADDTCKLVEVNTALPPYAMPAGYKTGFYVSWYKVTDSNPSITGSGKGWGERFAPPMITTNLKFLGEYEYNNAIINYQRNNQKVDFTMWPAGIFVRYGFVAYSNLLVKNGGVTLNLYVYTDDGFAVYINDKVVFQRWDLHAPTVDYSTSFTFDEPGLYPIKIVFFQWDGERQFQMGYQLKDETGKLLPWSADGSERFFFNVKDADQETALYEQQKTINEANYQTRLTAAQQNLSKIRIRKSVGWWSASESIPTRVTVDKSTGILWYVGPHPNSNDVIVALSESNAPAVYPASKGGVNYFDPEKMMGKWWDYGIYWEGGLSLRYL